MKVNGWYFRERKPDAVVGGCICIYENVWPNPQKTIADVEKEVANSNGEFSWYRAETVGHGIYQQHRTNKNLHITAYADTTENQVMYDVNNVFTQILIHLTNSYVKSFQINEKLSAEPISLLKYENATMYGQHYDSGPSLGRILSALCYLNSDYEGGEIEFPYFKIKIKPQPGMVILFPSNFAYAHIAHPVTKGTKYSLVTWIKEDQ